MASPKPSTTRAEVKKMAAGLAASLKGKSFIGGDAPSREDAVQFRAMFGKDNQNVVRWAKNMAAETAEGRAAWPQAAAKPTVLASVSGQKRGGYSGAAPAAEAGAVEKEKSTARRDELVRIEHECQKRWEEAKIFEVDPPEVGEADNGKFMATFPYPYMNGKLHFGHSFTVTKAEFAVAFNRLLGKRSIFPFGFHCTGMPIQAAANKLKREYEVFGSPSPTFPCGKPVPHPSEAPSPTRVHILWAAPTSTRHRDVTGYTVEMAVHKAGAHPEWGKATEASAQISSIEFDGVPKKRAGCIVDGLEPKTEYIFRVVAHLADGDSCPTGAVSDPIATAGAPRGDEKKKPAKGQVKAKIAAKTGDAMHQWDILRSMQISEEDCTAFADPLKWLQYFPPLGAQDLQRFGCHVDFRRSFITTSENQYYDKFVRWQFNRLKKGQYIEFGKRPTVYSETDGQACMDHDRAEGEGVGPQAYTGVKIEVLDPRPPVLADVKGKVFLIAATMRPETMCGQTNCWIKRDGEYGCFDMGNGETFVMTYRAGRNMSFQDLTPEWGKIKQTLSFYGREILGARIHCPTSPYDDCRLLPMDSIKMDKGTGVVTSVPSDSPDDYAWLKEMEKKADFYGIQKEWLRDPVPIIECVVDDGEPQTMSAQYMYDKLKVQGPGDKDKLQDAHDVVYKAGFYSGKMIYGPFKGLKVSEAKDKTVEALAKAGHAFTYHEPAGLIVGRSGDECVIALIDQWYLKYGEQKWRAKVEAQIEKMELFNPATTKAFKEAAAWFKEWACSRSFGLGTKIPWDEKFVIESLSDSTIYMAYYAIAKFLQGPDNLDGKKVGPAGITPDDLNDEVFDYIFLKGPLPAGCKIPEKMLAEMRREFEYWYPMDLRVSGKDLIQNHLLMSLYNHSAIWEDESMWPRSFFTNGWILVNGEKMSKQKGNFMTLREACDKFSADACRITCADAGDGLENANFAAENADSAILKLSGFIEYAKRFKATDQGRPADQYFVDRWFSEEMKRLGAEAKGHFEQMKFREAVRCGWFDFSKARDVYIDACPGEPHQGLIRRWIEWQTVILSVFCPHVAEHVWSDVLGMGCSVINARYPDTGVCDSAVIEQGKFLLTKLKTNFIAVREKAKGTPTTARVYVAKQLPQWKAKIVEFLKHDWKKNDGKFSATMLKELGKFAKEEPLLKARGKNVNVYAAAVKAEAEADGEKVFDTQSKFDEVALIGENKEWIRKKVRVDKMEIRIVGECEEDAAAQDQASPGAPSIVFV